MSLPKIKIPFFDSEIPSNGTKIKYRPFLMKEEKILLIASSGNSTKEIISSLYQVINNCIVQSNGKPINIDKLTTFDLEFLFLKIRSKSVDNVVNLKYHDAEDGETRSFTINLDDVKLVTNQNNNHNIKVNDEVSLIMAYPTAKMMMDLSNESISESDMNDIMLRSSIKEIYTSDTSYLAQESTKEELDEFIDSLPSHVFKDIQKFFDTMPKLYYKIEYTNNKGTARIIELSSLEDFFTLG